MLASSTATTFLHANVLSMIQNEVLVDQVVIVREGRIETVGPFSQVPILPDAECVDATGKFLMPGLCDMHVHVVPTNPSPGMNYAESERRASEYLLMFLANGVTTVRNMAGTPFHLKLRARVASGDILGPQIFTCGPILESRFTFPELAEFGQLVTTREEARSAVQAHYDAGYDFIKVYNDIDAEIYDEIVAAARSLGIPVVGHVAFSKGLHGALAARQDSIEHLRSYDFAVDTRSPEFERRRFEGWLYATPTRIAELAEKTAAAGTWNVPTLVIERSIRSDAEMPRKQSSGGTTALSQIALPEWLARKIDDDPTESLFSSEQRETLRKGAGARGAMVKALDDVGAGVLVGSDCPGCRLIPGRSLLRELELFVEAGISPWRALRAATVQAAKFLGLKDAGTVAPGNRADLLLLDADPRQDIRAIRRQAGVMVAGYWLDSKQLNRMIATQAGT